METNEQLKRSLKNNKKRKFPKLFSILILVLLITLSVYLFKKQIVLLTFQTFFEDGVKKTLEDSYVPLEHDEIIEKESKMPYSILLIGTDQRESEPARSDTLIYSIVRPAESKILLVSIPRDSYTTIIGYKGNVKSKINSAYAHGGVRMTTDTVEALFDQPVQYYATINFNGLINIVDTLGGVKLPITNDIVNKQKDHDKFTIKANKPIYSGEEALNYVRYREDSDFNRTARQREFIGQLFKRFKVFGNITKLDEVIKIGGDNLQTNMRSEKIINLAKSAIKDTPMITSYMLKGKDATIKGVYYYMLDEDDIKYITNLIEEWLNPNADLSTN